MAVNALAPGVLAQEAKRLGSGLVHYSTDYVFDGTKREPYTEEDVFHPINLYGESRLAGDRAVEATGGAYLILRTSWVYGGRGRNFFLTIRKLARERQVLQVIDDQVGCPTWCQFLAEATTKILATMVRGASDPIASAMNAQRGVYNLSAEGQISWCGFARAILETDPLRGEIIAKQVIPIPSEDHPSGAKRPPYPVLSKEKVRSGFGIEIHSWERQLADCWRSLSETGRPESSQV
jgi:dTDP-4-dehydrorhamnose reductase